VLAMALLALPKQARSGPILVRADTAGATHGFANDLAHRKLLFSIGFPIESEVQTAILAAPPPADGDDAGWPVGTRAICRRERPHPGAAHKTGFTDHTGHRFRVFITNQPDPDPATLDARHHAQRPAQAAGRATSATAALEVGHRAHARVEDRIRAAKATGLANLPFSDFDANDVWLTLVLVAQTLVAWAQALLLDGELSRAEPKTLRYRLWHAAARLVRHARQVILRFDRDWPWAPALLAAFARLRALPWPARC
jgi:Transposase DDE domain group 1